jgi:DNA helicase MCM9
MKLLLLILLLIQSAKGCGGANFQLIEDSITCHDYQEIKIQENIQLLGVGSIPRSMPIILMDDLVDIVKAGGKQPFHIHAFT